MNKFDILPMEIENIIIPWKKDKWDKLNLAGPFPNKLMREDALKLLDKFCIVVYYPIGDEKNHGFHITDVPFKSGKKENFVFIDTKQTKEKQVFTAAHELGHIWDVDKFVLQNIAVEDYNDYTELNEKIISRFAAILLMPADEFKATYKEQFEKYSNDDGKITVANMLKLIAVLMMHFFAPRKSVIYRCVELEIIPIGIANILLGESSIRSEIIDNAMREAYSELGYVQFLQSYEVKWIDGLAEILEKAEQEKNVPQRKIDVLRKKFNISKQANIEEMNDVVPVDTQEGNN